MHNKIFANIDLESTIVTLGMKSVVKPYNYMFSKFTDINKIYTKNNYSLAIKKIIYEKKIDA